MADLLELTDGLPERALQADDVLIEEGEAPDHLYVLLEGELVVRSDGDDLIAFDQPGACIGEKAVLLNRPHRSSVVATVPTRVRVVEDAADRDPRQPRGPARGRSRCSPPRLELVESFLSDLQHQYRDHEGGLGMIGEVLGALAHHHGPTDVSPGSERDPDPLY